MKKLILALMMATATAGVWAQHNVLDLSGKWQFAMDPEGALNCNSKLDDHIQLPGSMPERLKGLKPTVKTKWTGSLYDSSFFYNPYMAKYRTDDNLKLPFFLTPDRHYVGDAWYRTEVMVPRSMARQRIMLYLERPHITTTLFVNGQEVGSRNSLSVAHEYDVTDYLKVGKPNTLCLRVNNDAERVGVGADSHSVTDQTQGNWNGIVGRIELRAQSATHIAHVDVFPNVAEMSVSARVTIVRGGKKVESVTLHLEPWQNSSGYFRSVKDIQLTQDTTYVDVPAIECTCKSDPGLNFLLWDEFNPNMCSFVTSLYDQKLNKLDSDTTAFGMRSITTKGKDILVNGRLTFMRGTVENCCFPLTGYPPTDKESWIKVFRKCKSYGLNHMRFHSYCPPEAAFEAADEVGFYLQPEGPSWPNHGVKLGNGQLIDRYLMEETQRMAEKYGNHPSFAMLSCGNEPAGNWVTWVSKFVDYWRAKDSRRIYTGASVGGSWAWQPKNQYHVKAGARGLTWSKQQPNTMDDFRANIDTVGQPFISHETGQWCAFPDFDEISQYTGIYKAKNFEIFRDILEEKGMGSRAKAFLQASGKLQTLCYKYEMEKTLRTPHYAGFQLLGLNDYSGQGTALVGPLNVLWQEKGYVDSLRWREFCAPITILARMPKFTYFCGEKIPYSIEVSNYGQDIITTTKARVQVLDKDSNIVAQNLFGGDDIAMGSCQELGSYEMSFEVTEPTQYILQAELFGEVKGKDVSVVNHWNLWVYPKQDFYDMEFYRNIFICKDVPGVSAKQALDKGETLLVLAGDNVTYGKGIVQQFTPVFWNTSWFKMKPPHTTGMYIEKEHPIFKYFPTDDFSDVQWWSLTYRRPVMLMDRFPKDFLPIVQPIDTWFLSRKLGMLFEAKVGNGHVLVTTLGLLNTRNDDPAQQQMLYALLTYVESVDFNPQQTLEWERLQELFTLETPTVNMFTNDSPDELKKGVR